MTLTRYPLICSVALLLAAACAQAAEVPPAVAPVPTAVASSVPAPNPMPPKQTLLEKAVELKSNKVDAKVLKITFPKGFKTPQHLHEGPGPRYVVKGRVRIEDGNQPQEYGPGQVFWETGDVMTAENVSDGEAELIIFEVSPQKSTQPTQP